MVENYCLTHCESIMHDALLQHICKFVPLTPAEKELVIPFFQPRRLRKKEVLFKEGRLCQEQFFVVKGCLHMYFVNEKGIEQTTQFAIENWWISDQYSLCNKVPSSFNIQAVETSDVISIDNGAMDQMLLDCPKLERYFSKMYQKAYAASQMRMRILNDYSREEMYLLFVQHFPDFVQRVPQYMLASYLGFTPEYLSEIRRKRIS